jgi:hypothetical protein
MYSRVVMPAALIAALTPGIASKRATDASSDCAFSLSSSSLQSSDIRLASVPGFFVACVYLASTASVST